ncbi:hypothetical protein YC2023_087469 [Brassica napus]|uniref:BHLH domain-containing protein n=3 Tax=Brassica TaxID=3705 RepID=A0A0D3DG29_BRAOL|nr:unnamed protein product [Brassica napus]
MENASTVCTNALLSITVPLQSSSSPVAPPDPVSFVPSLGSWAKPLYFKPPATPPEPSTPSGYDPAIVGIQLAAMWPSLNDEILNKPLKGKQSSRSLQPPIEKLPPPELKADGTLRFPWAARLSPQSRNLYRAATPTYRLDGTPEVSIPSKVLRLGPENKDEYIIGKFHRCSLPPGGLVHAVVSYMADFQEKKRKRRKEVRVVSNEENLEKIMHREVEKQRRQEMASLYASLRSLLPLEFIQGKRSTSDQLNEAVNYINYLQRNIKDMSSKRDELMLLSGQSFESRNKQSRNDNSNHVVIRPCLVGVEIVFSVLQTPLSSVLHVLSEHGLYVLSCFSSNVNGRLIHTLQAEVDDLALVDFADLNVYLLRLP